MSTFHIPFHLLAPPRQGITPAIATAINSARCGDARTALAVTQRAWQRAREQGQERGMLEAATAASIVHMIRGDWIAGVAAAIDAWHLARRLGDGSLESHAIVTLCSAAFNLGTHQDVYGALLACIEQAQNERDGELEVRARSALGIVLGDLRVFDEAAAQFERVLALVHVYRHTSSAARITANIANLHRKRASMHLAQGCEAEAAAELRKAGELAQRAFQLGLADDSIPARTDALAIRACVIELQGERDKALALLGCAAAIGAEAGCHTAILWVHGELGRMRLAAGDVEGARASYLRVLEIAANLRPNARIRVACEALAETDARLGNVAAAAEWRERARLEAAEFESWRVDTRRQLDPFLVPPP